MTQPDHAKTGLRLVPDDEQTVTASAGPETPAKPWADVSAVEIENLRRQNAHLKSQLGTALAVIGIEPLPGCSSTPSATWTSKDRALIGRPITDEDLDAIQRQIRTKSANAQYGAEHLTMLMSIGDVQAMVDRIRTQEHRP